MAVKMDLTDKEMEIFNREFDKLAALQLPEREFIDFYADHRDYILDTLKVAKNKFEAEFGGLYCESGQFGWSLVRPDPVISTSKTATINHWNQDITAVGWADWIGSSGSEIGPAHSTSVSGIGQFCMQSWPVYSRIYTISISLPQAPAYWPVLRLQYHPIFVGCSFVQNILPSKN